MTNRTKKLSLGAEDLQVIVEQSKNREGEVMNRTYSKGKFLGRGGFARVYEFISLDSKQIFAGKVIEKATITKSRVRQKLMSEIKIHRSLAHEHIVKFHHFFEDRENVYILLEICNNQSLSELLRRRKRLTEIETQCYLLQIISAMQYLHRQKVIHRDIKLGNLFLGEKLEVKMGDFGLASKLEFEGERKRTICGTPNYIAPEILDGSKGHSFEVDVWSLGVLAYTVLVGKPPFETNDLKTTYQRIKLSAYSFPDHVDISDEAKDLINLILVTDPEKRPSLEEILTFKFFQKNPIPKNLPLSTLAVPPSAAFLKHFKNTDTTPALTERNEKYDKSDLDAPVLKENFQRLNTNRDSVPDIKPSLQASQALPTRSTKENLPIEVLERPAKKILISSAYKSCDKGPDIFIKRWVDYSSKYGVGYLLSNSCIGVYFNDCSKLITDPSGENFFYQDRGLEERSFTISSQPADLKKKIMLVEHFKKYLKPEEGEKCSPKVLVSKFVGTQHASFFRLNNKVVHVRFSDKSEVLVSSQSKSVIYLGKTGETMVYPLAGGFENTPQDFSKRLRYIKEILMVDDKPNA